MSDQIVRALAPGIRVVAAITTELTEEARQRHACSPVAAAALGRTMTAALLLSETIKGDECLTIRVSGDGPLGDVVADTPLRHGVRGYVRNPQVDLPPTENGKLAVGAGVGKGMLHVTRFSPQRETFTGTVALISGEIAEDVTKYLLESEQTPSTVGLGVLVDPDGSRVFAQNAAEAVERSAMRAGVVTARCFDGLYHELFNERDSAPVFIALKTWLDARF